MSAARSDVGASGTALTRDLVDWYRGARRDLPWRRARDPYAVWVSETMLQQTRVQTVLPYYDRFMGEFPTVLSLAEAPEERVLALWSGLGYYRRARMLHAAAKRLAEAHGGRIPQAAADLRQLEGVGRYTAGAIASIAFGQRTPAVDGNVERVLSRLFAIAEDPKGARGSARIWRAAQRLVAKVEGDPGTWNQALMELGATVCAPREPRCAACPVRKHCRADQRGIANALPNAKERTPAATIWRAAVVLVARGSVLLARRHTHALFGGLWEPPAGEGGVAAVAERLKVDGRTLSVMGEVVHVLTHRRMRVEVARGALPRRSRWPLPGPEYDAIEVVPVDDLPLRGHSTLARKILILANVTAGGLR
jgi:A/G-specific adenine glycosylase